MPGPVAPVAPVEPVAPVAPVEPVAPVAPVVPVEPVAPVAPVEPVAPVGPDVPVPAAPAAPGVPAAPADPAAPAAPAAPLVPFGPVGPAGPVRPVGPADPEHAMTATTAAPAIVMTVPASLRLMCRPSQIFQENTGGGPSAAPSGSRESSSGEGNLPDGFGAVRPRSRRGGSGRDEVTRARARNRSQVCRPANRCVVDAREIDPLVCMRGCTLRKPAARARRSASAGSR